MYYATRMEQKVQYWWAGSDWTTNKAKAKLFASEQAALDELKAKRIHYFDSKTSRWVYAGVSINKA